MTTTVMTEPTTFEPATSSDDARWQAVADRDRSADGTFYYAVRSTGVFCRPGCPSRRPSRALTLTPGAGAADGPCATITVGP